MSTTNSEDAGRRGSGGYVTSGAMSDLRESITSAYNEADPALGADAAGIEAVLAVVEAYLREHDAQPKLGLATTHELITELMARAEVAKTVGETWPLYSTVGGSDE